jgi:hypothetical protein
MRSLELLLTPALLALVFYCAAPACGIVYTRVFWRRFRSRYFFLQKCPPLDYPAYRKNAPGLYRYSGVFDSFTGDKKISAKIDALNVTVNLADADIYLLLTDGTPEKLKVDKLPILTRGLQVFAGGILRDVGGELCLSSGEEETGKKTPEELVCSSGRGSNFYWNLLTRYSYVAGSFVLVLYALQFINRPAYQLTLIASIGFIMLPFLSLLPPGLLLTLVSRRLFAESAHIRVKKDLADSGGHAMSPKANSMETLSWLFLAGGEAANLYFIVMALSVLL